MFCATRTCWAYATKKAKFQVFKRGAKAVAAAPIVQKKMTEKKQPIQQQQQDDDDAKQNDDDANNFYKKKIELERVSFVERHAINILHTYDLQNADKIATHKSMPLDLIISKYMRKFASIGTNNRKLVYQSVYDLMRWLLLLQYQGQHHAVFARMRKDLQATISQWLPLNEQQQQHAFPQQQSKVEKIRDDVMKQVWNKTNQNQLLEWRLRYHVLHRMHSAMQAFIKRETTAGDMFNLQQLPKHVQVSFPAELFDMIRQDYGEEQAFQICMTSNGQAPVFARVNPLKVENRKELIATMKQAYPEANIQVTKMAPYGIRFDKRYNFKEWKEYNDGLFEIQDEGSQYIANMVRNICMLQL